MSHACLLCDWRPKASVKRASGKIGLPDKIKSSLTYLLIILQKKRELVALFVASGWSVVCICVIICFRPPVTENMAMKRLQIQVNIMSRKNLMQNIN